jgi:hypothetical protein
MNRPALIAISLVILLTAAIPSIYRAIVAPSGGSITLSCFFSFGVVVAARQWRKSHISH